MALLTMVSPPSYAQETTTGSIRGQVTDQRGGVLPGATVTATAAHGTQTFVTDEQGRFLRAVSDARHLHGARRAAGGSRRRAAQRRGAPRPAR
jgi:Carboxypeptidase regulatory-like domain